MIGELDPAGETEQVADKRSRLRGRPPKAPHRSGDRPSLTEKQWAGLKVEARYFRSEDGRWSSTATLGQVALAAGVSRQAVSKWRKDPRYFHGLIDVISEEVSGWESEIGPEPAVGESKRANTANLDVFAKRNWAGPLRSPIDGKVYPDRESFLRHIADHPEVLWVRERCKPE